MSEITASKTLDARGLQCPMPVVRTTQEIKTIDVGQVLEVVATDPGCIADIQADVPQRINDFLNQFFGFPGNLLFK